MFSKITSALSSLTVTPPKLAEDHNEFARASTYVSLAEDLASAGVPVSTSDCARCDLPCPAEDDIWNGKPYLDYVLERYGDLGELPAGFDMDWETHLAGSAGGGRGRVVVVSTGKSDWEREHTDEKDSLSHHLHQHIQSLNLTPPKSDPKDFTKAPVTSDYIFPPASPSVYPPSLYSSSLISQSDDPEDQTVLVFPDWKVVQEVENSKEGAAGLYAAALDGQLGRSGTKGERDRRRSWVLPYRAVVLLSLHVVLAKHHIAIDETGNSLAHLDGPAIEDMSGSAKEKDAAMAEKIAAIEGIEGGEGGEVGIFNINHLGGHRYAGVMLVSQLSDAADQILFPSGAYISCGRVTPQEIPRLVEDTIIKGKIVPGLLRNAVGVSGRGSILGW